jgi:hypothetical protein
MIVFIGSGLLIGGLLGTRLTILALIPAAVLAVGIAAFSGITQVSAAGWNLSHLIVLLVFLQIGYLGGAGLSLCAVPMRVARRRSTGARRSASSARVDTPPASY